MAVETPSGASSLKDFLRDRAGSAPPKGSPPAPSAPVPSSESPATPREVTPPPKPATPRNPGFIRKTAGAISGEVFRGGGHVGSHITTTITGKSKTRVSRVGAATARGDAVKATKSGVKPQDSVIGKAEDLDDIEKQVIQLDKQQKAWGQYFAEEIEGVRTDVERVSVVATKAMKTVEQLKRDQRQRDFGKKVAAAQIRGKNGRFMTADQADSDPDSVMSDSRKPSGGGLVDKIWDSAKGWIATGSGALGGGLLAKRGFASLLSKAASPAIDDVFKHIEKPAAGAVARTSSGVLSTIARAKGGYIGTGVTALETMKKDSETGNHLRTWLRDKLGIEDEGEAAPWQGARSNEDALKHEREDDDKTVEGDAITIKSKKSVSVIAMQDILFDARNELTLKARSITLDAEKITLKGKVNGLTAAPTEESPRADTPASLSASDQRYDENVASYGREKADKLRDVQENRWSDPMSLLKKLNPFSGGSGRGTGAPESGRSGSLSSRLSSGTAPEGGRAQTDGSMKGDDLRKGVYNAFKSQGYSHEGALLMSGEVNRENGFNPDLVFGTHRDPHNGAVNGGMFSWQKERASALMEHLKGANALDDGGNIKRDQNSLDAMAAFAKREMDSKDYGGGRLNSELSKDKIDKSSLADDIGKNYIKWRVDDPRYRDGGVRNREAGYNSTARAVSEQRGSAASRAAAQLTSGGGSSAAVDLALQKEGLSETRDRAAVTQYLKTGGAGMDPVQAAWCAAFVNSSLKQSGVQGTGSQAAGSFQTWGAGVEPTGAQKGDVMVNKTISPRTGMMGSHVGLSTGNVKRDEHGNVVALEMVSGNSNHPGDGGGDVSRTWEKPGHWNVRRATEKEDPNLVIPEVKAAARPVRKEDAEATTAQRAEDKVLAKPVDRDTFDDAAMDEKDRQWMTRRPVSPEVSRPAEIASADGPTGDSKSDAEPVKSEPKTEVADGSFNEIDAAADEPKSEPTRITVGASPTGTETFEEKPKAVASGSSEREQRVEAPVNHPESEAPRPGSDGYGDKQHDPDDCGICAT